MNEGTNFNGYQDPLSAQSGQPPKKKASGSTVAATVVSVIVFFMFGIFGGLICFGGYWAVKSIATSRMPLAVRIVLSVIVGIIALALLIAFILFSATIQANI